MGFGNTNYIVWKVKYVYTRIRGNVKMENFSNFYYTTGSNRHCTLIQAKHLYYTNKQSNKSVRTCIEHSNLMHYIIIVFMIACKSKSQNLIQSVYGVGAKLLFTFGITIT